MLDTGEFVYSEVDLSIPGRGFDFVFARTYRSQSIYSGPLGWGWDHNYNKRLVELYSGDIIYYDGTGRRERYKKDPITRKYQAPKGWFTQLQKMVDGTFRLIYPDLTVEFFDSVGRLIKIQDRSNNKMEFFYDISGQLSTVMDTMGRLINLEYYPVTFNSAKDEVLPISARLWKITDFSDPVRTVEFKYYDNGDLKSVDFAGRVKQYGYKQSNNADIQLAHNLETYIDARGTALQDNTPVLKVIYNSSDQVEKQDFVELSQDITFNYGTSSTIVTDAQGNNKEFKNPAGTHREVINGGHTTTYDLDNDDLVTLITFPEGNMIRYTYDTNNSERRSQGNLLEVSSEGVSFRQVCVTGCGLWCYNLPSL
jgi:YD repeat-containing protein